MFKTPFKFFEKNKIIHLFIIKWEQYGLVGY
jgi:hypothetical protein